MYKFTVNGTEYKVKFGMNSFCDTDLMDRTKSLLELFKQNNVKDDDDLASVGKMKDLFICTRELIYVGFQKFNPVQTPQDAGNILDDYIEEPNEDGSKRGIMYIFTQLTNELLNEGFLADLMSGNKKAKGQKKKTVVEMPAPTVD